MVEVPQILTMWVVNCFTGWAGWLLKEALLARTWLRGRICLWAEASWQTPISAFHLWLWRVWLPFSESSCLDLLHSDKVICTVCLEPEGFIFPAWALSLSSDHLPDIVKGGSWCFKNCYMCSDVLALCLKIQVRVSVVSWESFLVSYPPPPPISC